MEYTGHRKFFYVLVVVPKALFMLRSHNVSQQVRWRDGCLASWVASYWPILFPCPSWASSSSIWTPISIGGATSTICRLRWLLGFVVFSQSPVGNLNAIPGFLDFFPGSSAYDLVRFRQCLLFFGECQDLASVSTTGSVGVVVSEGGCEEYLRDRSSCKDLVCAVSHVNLEVGADGRCVHLARMWYVVPQYCGGSSVNSCAIGVLTICLVALCWQLLWSVIACYLNSGCGFQFGRQAAWRPGAIGWCRLDGWWHCVGSCCGLCLLGTWALDAGLKLGRQAAWRPSAIWLVSSRWLVALCRQLLWFVIAWYLGSGCGAQIRSSSCLAAGYNSNGVVKLVGGTVQAVAVF